MARVACTVMLKDEVTLTAPFLRYHSALFGAENLYVVDNGTTEPHVLEILASFEREGVHVDRSFPTAEHYRGKGDIIGDLVKRLDREANYDFYILLDCDEFVVVRSGSTYTCDPNAIHRHLESFRDEKRILKVNANLSNIPGRSGAFQAAEYSKTIFPHDVLGATDHGHHAGWTREGATDFVPCDIVYVHFHFRPFEEVVRFARQKLAAEMPAGDLEDRDKLSNFTGRGWHLVKYVTGDEESYYRQFKQISNMVLFPELLDRFAAIGTEAPYSTFVRASDETDDLTSGSSDPSAPVERNRPYLIADEASTERVRGWATDPSTPDMPASVRFLVNGTPVWEGECNGLRPDVRGSGHPTDKVGFEFRLPLGSLKAGDQVLTAELRDGTQVRLLVDGRSYEELTLSAHRGQPAMSEPAVSGPTVSGATGTVRPHVTVDEASTARVRGWAVDPAAPDEPVFLRLLVDGVPIWEGTCAEDRRDVLKGGHPTGQVGFDHRLPLDGTIQIGGLLTIQDRSGTPMQLLVAGRAQHEVALTSVAERTDLTSPIYSHIDSFRNGRVRGWVLRTVATPEGLRLLGCCTVALVHQGRIVLSAVADAVRPDVAAALQGEAKCGFMIEAPRSLLSERDLVIRLFVMPERRELTGSPCVLAPSFDFTHV